MTIQELLAPWFEPCTPEIVRDMAFDAYKIWPGVNASILKEATAYEMLHKLQAMQALNAADARLLDYANADAADALRRLAEVTPRMLPRSFVKMVRPVGGDKATDKQKELVSAVTAGMLDSREFHGATLSACVKNGWVELVTKEVLEIPESEAVKGSRAEALAIGDATHAAVLEPHSFDSGEWEKRWQLCPTKSLVSEAAKEMMKADPRRLITPEIVDVARQCRDAVWKCKEAAHLLSLPGSSEVSVRAFDDEMKVIRKCRFDRLPDDPAAGFLDIKTTSSRLSPSAFRSEVYRFNYHLQISHYNRTLAMVEGKLRSSAFLIAVTKEPPFMARTFELVNAIPEASIYIQGDELCEQTRLPMFVQAYMTNQWEAFENESPVCLLEAR